MDWIFTGSDLVTFIWITAWVLLIVGGIVLCGWLANRPRNLADLDYLIMRTRADLDYLLADRARRFPTSSKPSFTELQDSANRMDHGN